ncbi:reverse transcriptase domain-containing protein [Clostridium perfringens]|uniref:reverse transcriptase domain-containing protein n=1 Tax=Clostridium perfringens TaxID=1502 RepID=UPI0024439E74|nr:reverse transcriptase domain-containing protein [Clostridium perfringens]MDG6887110.1 Reverse transcriptase (RNA-dependent DNA polymerase) [Clostridium perfringens]MDK0721680.1 reverse transcriptase domain-containing protein [Clostridium perfringens]MDK0769166.1 reverse transcriptase domain-containing protein [Clostridium perfringens]MDK0771865.1 reverse transcriptase domain-containing protein [Clostridium perfringens]MDK0777016.1 reverse transcriptase domain-containing protein [Clostridium
MEIEKETLNELFKRYIKFNTAVGIDKMTYKQFEENIDTHLEIICKNINNNRFKFSLYKEFLILKGQKKYPRIISIPTIRDKIVLKYIQVSLKEHFGYSILQKPPNEYISMLKKSVSKYKYANKYDISNFYGNINHKILFDKLKSYNVDKDLLKLIRLAITTDTVPLYVKSNKKKRKGLPQGLPISNILADIYIYEIDKSFLDLDVKIVRYVDDIIIMYNCDANIINNRLTQFLSELKIKLNKGKTKERIRLGNDNFTFLGYDYKVIYNKFPGFSVKKDNIYKFERKLISVFVRYDKDIRFSKEQFIFTLNNLITGTISRKIDGDSEKISRYGWLFFYSQIEDYTVIYNLDKLISNILIKYQKRKPEKWNKVNISEIKKFLKAFSCIKCNDYEYIHRPDDLTYDEKESLLINVFKININNIRSSEQVEKLYYKLVYKPVKYVQRDIQGVNSSL